MEHSTFERRLSYVHEMRRVMNNDSSPLAWMIASLISGNVLQPLNKHILRHTVLVTFSMITKVLFYPKQLKPSFLLETWSLHFDRDIASTFLRTRHSYMITEKCHSFIYMQYQAQTLIKSLQYTASMLERSTIKFSNASKIILYSMTI